VRGRVPHYLSVTASAMKNMTRLSIRVARIQMRKNGHVEMGDSDSVLSQSEDVVITSDQPSGGRAARLPGVGAASRVTGSLMWGGLQHPEGGTLAARRLVRIDSANLLEVKTANRGLENMKAATDIACRKPVGYTGECRAWAHVAQEAEHNLGKIEVPGSSPGVGSRSRCSSAVEQLFRKQQVVGSNPTTGSTKNRIRTRNRRNGRGSVPGRFVSLMPILMPIVWFRTGVRTGAARTRFRIERTLRRESAVVVSSASGARRAFRQSDSIDGPDAVAERSPERGSVLVAPVRVAGVPVPAERFVGRLLPAPLDPPEPELREGERPLVDRPGRRSGRSGPPEARATLSGTSRSRRRPGDRRGESIRPNSSSGPRSRTSYSIRPPGETSRTTEQPQHGGSGWAAERLHDPSDSSVD
jgi:hypothetical protein